MLGWNVGGRAVTAVDVHPTRRRVPLLGEVGEGVGDCRDVLVTRNVALFGSWVKFWEEGGMLCPFFWGEECVVLESDNSKHAGDK